VVVVQIGQIQADFRDSTTHTLFLRVASRLPCGPNAPVAPDRTCSIDLRAVRRRANRDQETRGISGHALA
jgi:hypothetical protein